MDTPLSKSTAHRAARRLDGVGSTIFAEMSALAVESGAINLGQGFPDVSGPDAVIDVAVAAMRAGRNQYPPGRGAPELVDAVRRHQHRHYGLELSPEQVVVTTGATEAIAAALLGLVDPGDEVVVLEPYYDSYRAMIQFVGGVRRPVTLRAPSFRLDTDELARVVSDRTRLLLVNSPHNPTGTVLDEVERAAIAEAAIRHDVVVVTDEVYEHLVFGGSRHVPLATMPGMFDRTLSISSSGKTFSLTGWKVGWASGPADLVAAVEGAKNWLSFSSGAPLQPAIAAALDEHDCFHRQLLAELTGKRDRLCSGLARLDVDVRVPEGTYFATTDVRRINRRLGLPDGLAFCRMLAERAGVVAIPAQVFYDDRDEGRHLVRWAFCKRDEVLARALERLAAADL